MIQDGCMVTIAYILKDLHGNEIDRADASDPFSYLQGAGQIVAGLEKALLGLKVGDKKTVVVAPKDGYGEVDESLKISLPRSEFPVDATVEPGVQFIADLGQAGKMIFTVISSNSKTVEVDGNHPLAGETLSFDVEVLGVRQATEEELKCSQEDHCCGCHCEDDCCDEE